MNRLNLIWQTLKTATLILAFWISMQVQAWAKGALPTTDSGGGSESSNWVAPYALVLLAIMLGMLFVCRSSRRADRAKPQEYRSITDN